MDPSSHDASPMPATTSKATLRPRRWRRLPVIVLALVGLMLLGPLGVLAFGDVDVRTHWSTASRERSGQAPDPRTETGPVVQVYGARTLGWRGAFGIHTWIATKRAGDESYTIRHVIGWRHYRGLPTVATQSGMPDFRWFGAYPELLVDRRGPGVDAIIDGVDAAVAAYPYADWYRAWPGPNSNTFTAFVARRVPELGLDLPANAIGKDFLPGTVVARLPSGTGWQLSLYGLLGVGVGLDEGVEFNLLGLSAGVDVDDLALRLPGIGRFGPGSTVSGAAGGAAPVPQH
jgi:hypothetical protein